MRILTIGQPDSPHNVSFLKKIRDNFPDANICFFASSPFSFHPGIKQYCDKLIQSEGRSIYYQSYWDDMFKKPLSEYSGSPDLLVKTINDFKPDFININAIQDAGYLFLAASQNVDLKYKSFQTNLFVWGNDLFYFRHHPLHKQRISEVLSVVNNLIPESSREAKLAWGLGFKGKILPPIEATLVTFEHLTGNFKGDVKNKENLIVIKSSFQSGRSLNGVALRALGSCAKFLNGWQLFLITPSLEDWRNLEKCVESGVFNILASTKHLVKHEFDTLLQRAKFLISLNLSDGVSNTFLECCASHTYPILSTSACNIDWGEFSAIRLDPYDINAAEAKFIEIFTNLDRIEQYTVQNFDSLKRYTNRRVNESIQKFFE